MVFWANKHVTIILPLLIAICLEPCLYSMLYSSRTKETIWLYSVLCIELWQQQPERKYNARRIGGPMTPILTSAYEWVQNSWRRQRWICRGSVGLGCIHHADGIYLPLTRRGKARHCPYEKQPGQLPQSWVQRMVCSRGIMNYAAHTHG